jgi:hypothetical protein
MSATTIRRVEDALLCYCARSRPPDRPLPRAPDAARPLDWDYLLATAEAHYVTELLVPSLSVARPDVPARLLEQLEQRFIQVTAQNLSRVSQLADLLQRFHEHGIRALAFKGPALAAGVYGRLGSRYSSDLDVLVMPRAASRVRALMLAGGYTLPARRRHRCGSLLHGLYPAAGRDDTFLPERPGLAPVDIHVAFAFWTQGIGLDAGALLDRAVSIDVGGTSITTLCLEDLLLVLAIHGMMHGWSALRSVSDIDAVARQIGDWDGVVDRARSARMLRILRVALLLGHDLVGTELPPHIVALAERDGAAVGIAERAAALLFDRPAAREWDPEPWHVAFLDGPRDRIRFHARRLAYEWFLKWPWDEWLGRRRGAGAPKGA